MARSSTRRLRRPKDKEALLKILVDDGPFEAYRDVLVFAAALGFREHRRSPIEQEGEAIRWDAAINRLGTDELSQMIAVSEADDAEILSEERFDERLRIFEEYANGGLALLGELLQARPKSASGLMRELVQQAFRTDNDDEAPPDLSSTELIV